MSENTPKVVLTVTVGETVVGTLQAFGSDPVKWACKVQVTPESTILNGAKDTVEEGIEHLRRQHAFAQSAIAKFVAENSL